MASARRPTQSKVATESSASAVGEVTTHGDDPRGSQGSDDHIVKNMADALKKSVNEVPHAQFKYQLTLGIDQEAKRCPKRQDRKRVLP